MKYYKHTHITIERCNRKKSFSQGSCLWSLEMLVSANWCKECETLVLKHTSHPGTGQNGLLLGEYFERPSENQAVWGVYLGSLGQLEEAHAHHSGYLKWDFSRKLCGCQSRNMSSLDQKAISAGNGRSTQLFLPEGNSMSELDDWAAQKFIDIQIVNYSHKQHQVS